MWLSVFSLPAHAQRQKRRAKKSLTSICFAHAVAQPNGQYRASGQAREILGLGVLFLSPSYPSFPPPKAKLGKSGDQSEGSTACSDSKRPHPDSPARPASNFRAPARANHCQDKARQGPDQATTEARNKFLVCKCCCFQGEKSESE